MPQYYLKTHGLDLHTDVTTLYAGSQESSILNVYTRQTQASATWPIPWKDLQKNNPQMAAELEVLAETQTLPNNSFMVHGQKVPASIAEEVEFYLSKLDKTPEGQALLERMNIDRVFIANEKTYQPVLDFIQNFTALIGDNRLLKKQSP